LTICGELTWPRGDSWIFWTSRNCKHERVGEKIRFLVSFGKKDALQRAYAGAEIIGGRSVLVHVGGNFLMARVVCEGMPTGAAD
jgi:hypothetical protein